MTAITAGRWLIVSSVIVATAAGGAFAKTPQRKLGPTDYQLWVPGVNMYHYLGPIEPYAYGSFPLQSWNYWYNSPAYPPPSYGPGYSPYGYPYVPYSYSPYSYGPYSYGPYAYGYVNPFHGPYYGYYFSYPLHQYDHFGLHPYLHAYGGPLHGGYARGLNRHEGPLGHPGLGGSHIQARRQGHR
jgi:hypothetical protein